MSGDLSPARWLSETEMHAWRSYVVATLRLRQRLHRELVETHKISLTDYEVLVCVSLKPDEKMRMSELATMLGSTKSRLSHQVGRMEVAGFVARMSDPEDKRAVIVELTGDGRALLQRAAPTHVVGVRTHLIDRLSPTEQQVLGDSFRRVLAGLEEFDY
jgi:DNA-binding MarR family transcriptional regulator